MSSYSVDIGKPEIGGLEVGAPTIGGLEVGKPKMAGVEVGRPEMGLADIYKMAKSADLRSSVNISPLHRLTPSADKKFLLMPPDEWAKAAKRQVSPWDDPKQQAAIIDKTWQSLVEKFDTVESSGGAMQMDPEAGFTMSQLPSEIFQYFPKGSNPLGMSKKNFQSLNPDEKRLFTMLLHRGMLEAKEREQKAAEELKTGKIAGEER